jgi:DNA-binding winged helix-turn-helix (wHTH) protein
MRYGFGPFLLDTETLILFRGEERISVTPKAIETLRVLLENPGRVVDKRELLTCVWGEVYVEEANLTQIIFALRRSLGETPRDHRFIVPVPGKGYRFVAEVTRDETSFQSPQPAVPNVAPGAKLSRYISSRQAHFLLLTLTIVLWITGLALRDRNHNPPNYSAVPLTSYIGSALCPSFAPDGERVAFSWNGEGQDNFDIYVKQIGLGLPLRLTTDARPEVSPAWSPDGRTVAFLRLSGDKAELLLIPSATNGPERLVAELTAPNRMFSLVRFVCWSPDSKWLIAADGNKSSIGAGVGLSLISVETGEKRRLTHPAPWNDDLSPAMSPDMQHLVFACHTGAASDLYALNLATNLQPLVEAKQLTFDHQMTSSPVWMPDGKSLLFTRYSTRGIPGLWRMSLLPAPKRPEPVPIAADNASLLGVSPKGDSLVFTRGIENDNLWGLKRRIRHYGLAGPGSVNPGSLRANRRNPPSSRPTANRLHFNPRVLDGVKSGSPTATAPMHAS